MAKHTPKGPTNRPIQLVGAEEVAATYSDVFLVVTENETRMSTIYFFQSQLSFTGIPNLAEGTKQLGKRQQAKCVAQIILTEKSLEVLFNALGENRKAIPRAESGAQK